SSLGSISSITATRIAEPVPEPATITLFGMGIIGLWLFTKKKQTC
nr:PEP-CTERM sorting domain-containing protein [Desulfobulbaceae bacterium]